MTANEFIKKLKEEIHKNNYKTSELIINSVVSHGSNCHEVYLYDKKTEEPVYVVVEKD